MFEYRDLQFQFGSVLEVHERVLEKVEQEPKQFRRELENGHGTGRQLPQSIRCLGIAKPDAFHWESDHDPKSFDFVLQIHAQKVDMWKFWKRELSKTTYTLCPSL